MGCPETHFDRIFTVDPKAWAVRRPTSTTYLRWILRLGLSGDPLRPTYPTVAVAALAVVAVVVGAVAVVAVVWHTLAHEF